MSTSKITITGLALALVALSGCAGAEPGVVAYVQGTRITQAQLDQAVTAASESLGQEIPPANVLNALIGGELSARIAVDRSIPLDQGEQEALIRESQFAPLLDRPDGRPLAFDLADQNVVFTQLGAEGYGAEVSGRDVVLNPRFGQLDPATKTIAENSSGSLSVPAAQGR